VLTVGWPAGRAVRLAPQAGMRTADPRLVGSRHHAAAARWLMGTQMAISFVLLVASLMFVRTMLNLRSVDLGFSTSRVLTMSLNPLLSDENAAAAREQFWGQVLERVRALPGVVKQIAVQLAIGLIVGVPAALAVARMSRSLLFGVTPGDAAPYVLAIATLGAIACLAAWLPARRAASIDPVEALRCE
jgi:hypothetical protein